MIRDRKTMQYLEDSAFEMGQKIEELEKWLKNAPEGEIRLSPHRDKIQYYLRKEGEKSGKYIPQKCSQLAYDLMQKVYYRKVIILLKADKRKIEKLLEAYDPDDIIAAYDTLDPRMKPYVKAMEPSDEEALARWETMVYEGKEFAEDAPEYYTDKGERVRSKSEVMIANALARAGIPYRYECPLFLDGRTIYPDFTILRLRDRQEAYWEHFGLIEDSDYAETALKKVHSFESCGIYLGERLILTAETEHVPLSSAVINRKINRFLL